MPRKRTLSVESGGWENDGQNHINLKTWNLKSIKHDELIDDLARFAAKYPGFRFNVEVWHGGTRDQCLAEMKITPQ